MTLSRPRSHARPGLAVLAALALLAGPVRAAIEDGYDPTVAPVPSTWYAPADPAALRADRAYVAGMRPHHAGALSMCRATLSAVPSALLPWYFALFHAWRIINLLYANANAAAYGAIAWPAAYSVFPTSYAVFAAATTPRPR